MQQRYKKADTDTWIEDSGVVIRLLSDDREGSQHQRFVVRIGGGQTLLIAHNIELAERVPLGIGDRISFRGVYEFNDEGGLVHWTHHDPYALPQDRQKNGGYVKFRSRRYA